MKIYGIENMPEWTWAQLRRIKWHQIYHDLINFYKFNFVNKRTALQRQRVKRLAGIFKYDKASSQIYLHTSRLPPDQAMVGGGQCEKRIYIVIKPADKAHYIRKCFFDPAVGGYRGTLAIWKKLQTGVLNISREDVRKVWATIELKQMSAPQRTSAPQPIASSPRNRLQVDLVFLQNFKFDNANYQYLMVCVDHFSKYVWVFPLKIKDAEQIQKIILTEILYVFGKVNIVHTDNGTEFNRFDKLIDDGWFNKHVRGEPYHSTSQGAVERANRTIRDTIVKFIAENNTHYSSRQNRAYVYALPYLVHSYNTSCSGTTKLSPASTFFNCMQHISLTRLLDTPPITLTHTYNKPRGKVEIMQQGQFIICRDDYTGFVFVSPVTRTRPSISIRKLVDDIRMGPCLRFGHIVRLIWTGATDNMKPALESLIYGIEGTVGGGWVDEVALENPSTEFLASLQDIGRHTDLQTYRRHVFTHNKLSNLDKFLQNNSRHKLNAHVSANIIKAGERMVRSYHSAQLKKAELCKVKQSVCDNTKTAEERIITVQRSLCSKSVRKCRSGEPDILKPGTRVRIATRLYKKMRKTSHIAKSSLQKSGEISKWTQSTFIIKGSEGDLLNGVYIPCKILSGAEVTRYRSVQALTKSIPGTVNTFRPHARQIQMDLRATGFSRVVPGIIIRRSNAPVIYRISSSASPSAEAESRTIKDTLSGRLLNSEALERKQIRFFVPKSDLLVVPVTQTISLGTSNKTDEWLQPSTRMRDHISSLPESRRNAAVKASEKRVLRSATNRLKKGATTRSKSS